MEPVRHRRTGADTDVLHRQANDHLIALPALLRAEQQERENRRTYMNGLRSARRQIKADMRAARTAGDAKEFNRLYEYLRDVQQLIEEGWN